MSTTLYSLPRDARETARLNGQHEIYISSIGCFLQPEIVFTLPANAKIADVGTGTGIWLEGLATQSPSTYTFEGLDISDAQFPPSHASNITFGTYNLLHPVPEALRQRYDVVHLRLLVGGLAGDESWRTACKHVFDLLKPGGFVQWEEGDYSDIRSLKSVDSGNTSSLRALIHEGMSRNTKTGKAVDMPPRLAKLYTELGFINTHNKVSPSDRDPKMRNGFNKATLGALLATLTWHASQPDSTVDMAQVKRLYDETQIAIEDDKTYVQVDIYCVIGQKPH